MIILSKQKTPKIDELLRILKDEFSNHYSFRYFGVGPKKSIIVRKSTWVGAQIIIRENSILVDGSFPSVFTSSLMSLVSTSTLAPVNQWFEVEQKLAGFLNIRYS